MQLMSFKNNLLSRTIGFFWLLDCVDNHEKCGEWASIGECENNPNWMLKNCEISCNVCQGKRLAQFPSKFLSVGLSLVPCLVLSCLLSEFLKFCVNTLHFRKPNPSETYLHFGFKVMNCFNALLPYLLLLSPFWK